MELLFLLLRKSRENFKIDDTCTWSQKVLGDVHVTEYLCVCLFVWPDVCSNSLSSGVAKMRDVPRHDNCDFGWLAKSQLEYTYMQLL